MSEKEEDFGRPRAVSLGTKVKQIAGLKMGDVTTWEINFIDDVQRLTWNGANTTRLTEKQIEVIERIWSKHFA
jgi:hypothetical protein